MSVTSEGDGRGYVPIETLDLFRELEDLCDALWDEVSQWSPLARETVGLQLVRSIDSVGANLVEGDGRYSDRESLHFFSFARASGREACFWLRRAQQRCLLAEDATEEYLLRLQSVLRRLNALMTSRRSRLGTAREDTEPYPPSVSDQHALCQPQDYF